MFPTQKGNLIKDSAGSCYNLISPNSLSNLFIFPLSSIMRTREPLSKLCSLAEKTVHSLEPVKSLTNPERITPKRALDHICEYLMHPFGQKYV